MKEKKKRRKKRRKEERKETEVKKHLSQDSNLELHDYQ
jgi:hypothetical protein